MLALPPAHPRTVILSRYECFPGSAVIATTGKFHGCPLWAAHYWELAYDGGADSEEQSGEYTFQLGAEDWETWPELQGCKAITLWQDKQGYVLYYANTGMNYEAGPAGRLPDGFEGSGSVVSDMEIEFDLEANAQRGTNEDGANNGPYARPAREEHGNCVDSGSGPCSCCTLPEDTEADRLGDLGLKEIKRIGENIVGPQAPKDWPFVVYLHLGRANFSAGDIAGAIGELGFHGQGVAA